MPAYNFQKQFVPKILDGSKLHTIRRRRKRSTRAGDRLLLYTGMRTKQCELIAVTGCVKVVPILISTIGNGDLSFGAEWLTRDEQIALAKADGFDDIAEFFKFFKRYKADILADFEVIWWDPKWLITKDGGQVRVYG